eukprot:g1210.t1
MSVVDAALATGSSIASNGDETESNSDSDSDMDDIIVGNDSDAQHQQSNKGRTNVPILNLSTITQLTQNRRTQRSNAANCSDSNYNNPVVSTRVDLLSEAFRIKPELMKQATENEVSLEDVIANGFYKALNVQKDELRFYVLEEITSPRRFKTDGVNNKHIAVAVNSSSFSLSSLESLVEQNKQTSSKIEDCIEKLQISEDQNRVLEFQLAHAQDQLKQSEEETRRLNREIEFLRDGLYRQQQSSPSPVSDPLISPRLLTSSGGQQNRLSNRMIQLQQLVTDNQQLISDLSRRVRTQTEIESLMR